MGKIARSWDLVEQSFLILTCDMGLMFFPVVSAISCIAISVVMLSGGVLAFRPQIAAWAAANAHDRVITQTAWAYFFVFYLVNYFIVVFFNVALVSAAADRLAGGHGTVNDALQIAWKRKGKILQWAIVAATVGVLLSVLENRLGWLARFTTRLIGTAWTLASYFVVPVLAAADVGPVEALYRSASAFRETWGEELVGGFSFGLIFTLLSLPGVALFFWGRTLGRTGMLTGMVLAVLYWLLLSIVSSAVQGIFTAALYRFATTKQVAAGFSPNDLSDAWHPRE
jgi:hypothetical protein